MSIYEKYRLTKVINARGPATVLGAAKTTKTVSKALADALSINVEMVELQARASEAIARFSGAEAGFVTNCSAAGISLAVAASMTGTNIAKIKKIPNVEKLKNKIIIQKGQMVQAGETPLDLLVRITGATLIEIGEASDCAFYQLKEAIDNDTAAALYINTIRARLAGMIPPGGFIKTCHEKGIPVIVDDAGGLMVKEFINAGADLVVFSSQKWIGGPTAGLIAGKRNLAYACFLQENGIGRPMKAGKESIIGAITALNEWERRDWISYNEQHMKKVEYIANRLQNIPGVKVEIQTSFIVNSPGLVLLTVNPEVTKITAWEINRLLEKQNPVIKTRDHDADHGYFTLNPFCFDDGDEKILCDALIDIFQEASKRDLVALEEVPTYLDHVAEIYEKWLDR